MVPKEVFTNNFQRFYKRIEQINKANYKNYNPK